jgi:hypothetical protein
MFLIYKTTNKTNGKIYIGVHECNKDCKYSKSGQCSYLGSGTAISKAVKKHGAENFIRETMFEFETLEQALEKERSLVMEDFVKSNLNYNLTVGGGLPPNQSGFVMSEEAKEKIAVASKNRSAQISETAKQTMKTRSENGGWTEDEIRKRVKTRRKVGSYNNDMKACNTKESIKKRVETKKKLGQYDNVKTDQLQDKEIVFRRTRTRIINLIKKGMVASEATMQKYNITSLDLG